VKQTVLLLGSGGREHALAWKISQSPLLEKLYIAPGNAGTADVSENVPIPITDIPALLQFAKDRRITFVVVGPDDALAAGVVDAFQKIGLRIFGPTQAAAQMEASKAFAKEIMKQANVPTAAYQTFTDFTAAIAYVEKQNFPLFVKASGLALGKGAVRCNNLGETKQVLTDMMQKEIFGESGKTVVIEELMTGTEISLHALCDGQSFHMLPSSQENKPIFNEGKGPNTGGMGTVAPLPHIDQTSVNTMAQTFIQPILSTLKRAGNPFKGLLYPGIMLTKDGPKIVEYNARFGDPETQVYMRLLESDLLELLMACADGSLSKLTPKWSKEVAICVVVASGGYPGSYEKGKVITGIAEAEKLDGIKIFHAGTALKNGQLVTNGGRVLGVTAVGKDLAEAKQKAYEAVKLIDFEGMYYRTDIGKTATEAKL